MNKILIAVAAVLLLTTTFMLLRRPATVKPQPTLKAGSDMTFHEWCIHYNVKLASPEEEAYRMKVFEENQAKISAHPKDSTYTLGQNQFMITTHEEFQAQYLTLLQRPQTVGASSVHVHSGSAPTSQDWTKKGDVTPIKDQGQCGSCWAFSTTGSVESATKIGLGELPSLSEQQLVDCSGSYGNMGCNGGLMDYAFKYIEAKGITTEDAYPYKAVDQKCKVDGGKYHISTYTDVPSGSCDSLQDAVGNKQPVSIGVDAETWQFYSGGVFSDCGTSLDHGVLAAGYNFDGENGSGYWIVKNSWGTTWGQKGYIWLKEGNTCGICNTASYPTASK